MGKSAWSGPVAVALLCTSAWAMGCANEHAATCPVAATPKALTSGPVDFVDVLFVVDNSGSMRQEQSALRAQFPRLVDTLTTGRTSAGATFKPVRNLHLGVVSTDMGLAGIPNNFPSCNTQRHVNGGDDGQLQHTGGADVGCNSEYPPFLSFELGQTDPVVLARDFGCIANLGTTGCGFEQQLEAGLKALWPKVYVDAEGRAHSPEDNPIQFLSASESGRYGRGDQPLEEGGNLGFLRNDPAQGLSLVAIIVVSDEEDCSSSDTSHFVSTNNPDNPLSRQGINLRCHYNKQNLFDIERYVLGYKGLRPGNEQLVVFGAIAGVPPDLVDEQARAEVDFESDESPSREAYYERLLTDPRMQEVPVNQDVPSLANVTPSCTREDASGEPANAYPPRRMVEVARAFGPNGIVQSICQDDFGPAIDAILAPMVYQLQSAALTTPEPSTVESLLLSECAAEFLRPKQPGASE
jgi:hypothetical protein